ncbi:hypothetical protein HDV00_002601 [Rhizophlyctis rosea]|nr:hypothetical protein HDV00_002601 [Rhizophlyctis rosea]
MVNLFSWMKKREDDDWEKILADFDAKIRKAEVRISDLAIRERRVLYAFLLYSIPIYAFYTLIYFTYFRTSTEDWEIWLAKTSPVIIGPPLLYTIRRFIRYYYTNRRRHEVVELENLKIKQKEKVEELKKKTAYYMTKGLIERYDSPSGASPKGKKVGPNENNPNMPRGPQQPGPHSGAPNTGRPHPFQPAVQPAGPTGLQRQGPSGPQKSSGTPPGAPNAAEPRRPEAPTFSPPSQKGWLDKVVDVMIGDSDGPQSKYALICEECFTHNGLVPPEAYSSARFRCMKCNHLNVPKTYHDLGLHTSPSGELHDDHLLGDTPTPLPRIRNASAPEVLLRGQVVEAADTASVMDGSPLAGKEEDAVEPYALPTDVVEPSLDESIIEDMQEGAEEAEGLRNRRSGAASGEAQELH